MYDKVSLDLGVDYCLILLNIDSSSVIGAVQHDSRRGEDDGHEIRPSRSRSRHRRRSRSNSRRRRHRHRSRSHSRNSSRVQEHLDDMVRESLRRVLDEQRAPASGQQSEVEADIKNLKKSHKELSIEKSVSGMKSEGAKSQFRAFANMNLRIESAMEKLEEAALTFEDPESPLYQTLASVREELSSAQEIGIERCDLIRRADEDPVNGWKALTEYEKMAQNKQASNPERAKMFSECVKKVSDEKKKKNKVTAPQLAASLSQRPFSVGPGFTPGSFYGQQQQFGALQQSNQGQNC